MSSKEKLKEIKDYSWGTECQCGHNIEDHYLTQVIPCSRCLCNEFKKKL